MVKVYSKNKVPQVIFSGKISRSFICPSLNNSEQEFKKNICFKIIGSDHTLNVGFFFGLCAFGQDMIWQKASKNLKPAHITPLHIKDSYKPVSILPSLSKIIEKYIYTSMSQFF